MRRVGDSKATPTAIAGGGEYRRVKCYVRVRPLIEHELVQTETGSNTSAGNVNNNNSNSMINNNNSSFTSSSNGLARRSPVEPLSPLATDPTPLLSCIAVGDDEKSLRLAHDVPATFDGVFSPETSLQEIANSLLPSTLSDVLLGYHNALLFYGQTGSGKTHTVQELLPTFVRSLFTLIEAEKFEYETTVSLECVQIYLERVSDLIDTRRTNLQIREFPDTGVYVRGAVEQTVSSSEELLALWDRATRHRVTAETRLNPVSSRSHCVAAINVRRRRLLKRDELDSSYDPSLPVASAVGASGMFRQRIRTPDRMRRRNSSDGRHAQTGSFFRAFASAKEHSKDGGGGNSPHQEEWAVSSASKDNVPSVTCGKVFFVDLAGSERLKLSKSEGLRQTEAIHINQSLSSLGKVMSALANPKATHVPYRDSKLTRMLQESLGGGGCSAVIVCLSPWTGCLAESRLSVSFGLRAMEVVQSVSAWREVDSRARLMEVQEWLEHRVHFLEEQVRVMEEEREQFERTGHLLLLNGPHAREEAEEEVNDDPTDETAGLSNDCTQCKILQAELEFVRNERSIAQRSLAAAATEFELRISQLESALELANNDCEYYRSQLEEKEEEGREEEEKVTSESEKKRLLAVSGKGFKSALAQRKMTELNEYWEGYASSVEAELATVTAERDDACKELFAMTQRLALERSSILETSSVNATNVEAGDPHSSLQEASTELESLREEMQHREELIRDLQAAMDARELRYSEGITKLERELEEEKKKKKSAIEKTTTLESQFLQSEELMKNVMQDLNRLNERFSHVDAARMNLENLAKEREQIIITLQEELSVLQTRLRDETSQHEEDVERLHAAAAIKGIEASDAQHQRNVLAMSLERQAQRVLALEESCRAMQAELVEKETKLREAMEEVSRHHHQHQHAKQSKEEEEEREMLLGVAQERSKRIRRECSCQEECDRMWLHCEAAESYVDSLYSLFKNMENEACVLLTDTQRLQKYIQDLERKHDASLKAVKNETKSREERMMAEFKTRLSSKEEEMLVMMRREVSEVTRRSDSQLETLKREKEEELDKLRVEYDKKVEELQEEKEELKRMQIEKERESEEEFAQKKLIECQQQQEKEEEKVNLQLNALKDHHERVIKELNRTHREALVACREDAERRIEMIHETSAETQSSLNRTLENLSKQLNHAEQQLREERECLRMSIQRREAEMKDMELQLTNLVHKHQLEMFQFQRDILFKHEECERLKLIQREERTAFNSVMLHRIKMKDRFAATESLFHKEQEKQVAHLERLHEKYQEEREEKEKEMVQLREVTLLDLQTRLDAATHRCEELEGLLLVVAEKEKQNQKDDFTQESNHDDHDCREKPSLPSLRDALLETRDALLLLLLTQQQKQQQDQQQEEKQEKHACVHHQPHDPNYNNSDGDSFSDTIHSNNDHRQHQNALECILPILLKNHQQEQLLFSLNSPENMMMTMLGLKKLSRRMDDVHGTHDDDDATERREEEEQEEKETSLLQKKKKFSHGDENASTATSSSSSSYSPASSFHSQFDCHPHEKQQKERSKQTAAVNVFQADPLQNSLSFVSVKSNQKPEKEEKEKEKEKEKDILKRRDTSMNQKKSRVNSKSNRSISISVPTKTEEEKQSHRKEEEKKEESPERIILSILEKEEKKKNKKKKNMKKISQTQQKAESRLIAVLDPKEIKRITQKRHRDVRDLLRMGSDPSGTEEEVAAAVNLPTTRSSNVSIPTDEEEEEELPELKPYHRWITDAHRQVNRRLLERLDRFGF